MAKEHLDERMFSLSLSERYIDSLIVIFVFFNVFVINSVVLQNAKVKLVNYVSYLGKV